MMDYEQSAIWYKTHFADIFQRYKAGDVLAANVVLLWMCTRYGQERDGYKQQFVEAVAKYRIERETGDLGDVS